MTDDDVVDALCRICERRGALGLPPLAGARDLAAALGEDIELTRSALRRLERAGRASSLVVRVRLPGARPSGTPVRRRLWCRAEGVRHADA